MSYVFVAYLTRKYDMLCNMTWTPLRSLRQDIPDESKRTNIDFIRNVLVLLSKPNHECEYASFFILIILLRRQIMFYRIDKIILMMYNYVKW